MKIGRMLLIAFFLLVSACTAPAISQPVATVLSTIEPPSTPEPTLSPIQTEPSPPTESTTAIALTTYTDDFAGFSIDYPVDWFIDASAAVDAEQSFAYSVGIATWDLRNPPTPSGKNPDAIPAGGTKIDVNVVRQTMTLEEAVLQQTQNETGSPILAREDVTLSGSLSAVILDVEGFAGPIRTLITILNGNVIYVSGYGDLESFEDIALTLRAK